MSAPPPPPPPPPPGADTLPSRPPQAAVKGRVSHLACKHVLRQQA